jgi:prepilin-type N-terminal cleavage/methylation domain-containing protein
MNTMKTPPTRDRRGFTIVELLIALVIGLVLVAASLSFAISTFQGAEANKVREEVYRNARFINMSLQRDIQTAGVGIESDVEYGTLNVFNDTIVVLNVPWTPTLAHAYNLVPPAGTNNPLAAGGTCGARCIDLAYKPGGGYDLAVGDLARLQVNAERRLIMITVVRDIGTRFQIEFLNVPEILHHEAGFAGGLLLDRYQSTVQELQVIVYYRDPATGILYRSQGLTTAAALQPAPMAYGVQAWDAWLIFEDGSEGTAADPFDANIENDFDDLMGVRIATTLAANRADLRVNDGALFTNAYQWRIMPRNLMYERNR